MYHKSKLMFRYSVRDKFNTRLNKENWYIICLLIISLSKISTFSVLQYNV